MIEALKAPLPTILVFAGIIFLLVSVATIKKPIVIEITPTGRIIAGIIGGLILVIGIVLFIYPPAETPAPTSTPAPTPTAQIIPTLTAVPTPQATSTPRPLAAPAALEVERLELYFQGKGDLPPILPVPPKVLTAGAVTNFDPDNLAIRVFICSQSTNVCASQELPYLDSARWDKEIDIGKETDDCARFYLRFAIITLDENKKINSSSQPDIPNALLPKFIDVETYEVKRALNSDHSALNPSCP